MHDPETCQNFSVVEDHIDCTPIHITSGEAGDTSTRYCKYLCDRVRVEKADWGRTGALTIFPYERDSVATKLRKSFISLDRDVHGNVAVNDAIQMLSLTKSTLSELSTVSPITSAADRCVSSLLESLRSHTGDSLSFRELLELLDLAARA